MFGILVLPGVSRDPAGLAFLISTETTIGVFIGLVARMYLLALSFIGAAIANSIGLGGIGGVGLDESEPQAALGALISLFALIILFTLEFHHEMIRALVGSYYVFPVGAVLSPRPLLTALVDKLAEAFLIVLRFGSPFIAYALIVNLTVGLPQQAYAADPDLLRVTSIRHRGRIGDVLFCYPGDHQPLRGSIHRIRDREITLWPMIQKDLRGCCESRPN